VDLKGDRGGEGGGTHGRALIGVFVFVSFVLLVGLRSAARLFRCCTVLFGCRTCDLRCVRFADGGNMFLYLNVGGTTVAVENCCAANSSSSSLISISM